MEKGWRPAGLQWGEKREAVTTIRSRGCRTCVAWIREDGNGDSKSMKELAIDLQRPGEEGSILVLTQVIGRCPVGFKNIFNV